MIHIFKREEVADVMEAIYNLAEMHATIFWVWDMGYDFHIGQEPHWHELPEEINAAIKDIDWFKVEQVVSALAYAVYKYWEDPIFNDWYENSIKMKKALPPNANILPSKTI